MVNLGIVAADQGRYAEAETISRQVLEVCRRVLGDEHPTTLNQLDNLGGFLYRQKKHRESEVVYRVALEARRRILGDEHPATLRSMANLGSALFRQGKYAESEKWHNESLEIQRRVLGNKDSRTRKSLGYLVSALGAQNKLDEARPYVAELIAHKKRPAERPPADAEALNSHAWMLLTCVPSDLRDPEAAVSIAARAAELTGRQNAAILDTLALAHHMTDEIELAIQTQKGAIAQISAGESEQRAELESRLIDYLREKGDLPGIEELLFARYDRLRGNPEMAVEQITSALENVISLYEAWGKSDQAAEWRAKPPPGELASLLSERGVKLVKQGRHTEAEQSLRECLTIRQEVLPEGDWLTFKTMSVLGEALAGQERFDEAEPLLIA